MGDQNPQGLLAGQIHGGDDGQQERRQEGQHGSYQDWKLKKIEPIKDDYIFFSRKGSALIDNKNIKLINKTKIKKVKKDLISAGFKIISY